MSLNGKRMSIYNHSYFITQKKKNYEIYENNYVTVNMPLDG